MWQMSELLRVEDLRVYYRSIWGDYRSVDGVSMAVNAGEVFGIAGESGCGKSTLVEGFLGLVKPPGYVKSGSALFNGSDILKMDREKLRRLRWKELAYVPQGSMNALNPVIRVQEQMVDAVLAHERMPKGRANSLAIDNLKQVGLPAEVARMYMHELSGGMKQRVIIAMAMILRPKLVIADEPVTALDVVVQRSILQLIAELRDLHGATVMFVAHDLAAHAEIVDKMTIMYAGKLSEMGSVHDVFNDPLHPYSRALVASIPTIGKKEAKGIPGLAPSPLNWPTGCRFHPRCPHVMPICPKEDPEMKEIAPGRRVACHLFG